MDCALDSTAEKDKASFEDRRSATSVVIDNLQDNMKALSLRLESSEETVRNCKLIMPCCAIYFYHQLRASKQLETIYAAEYLEVYAS